MINSLNSVITWQIGYIIKKSLCRYPFHSLSCLVNVEIQASCACVLASKGGAFPGGASGYEPSANTET